MIPPPCIRVPLRLSWAQRRGKRDTAPTPTLTHAADKATFSCTKHCRPSCSRSTRRRARSGTCSSCEDLSRHSWLSHEPHGCCAYRKSGSCGASSFHPSLAASTQHGRGNCVSPRREQRRSTGVVLGHDGLLMSPARQQRPHRTIQYRLTRLGTP